MHLRKRIDKSRKVKLGQNVLHQSAITVKHEVISVLVLCMNTRLKMEGTTSSDMSIFLHFSLF